MDDAVEEEDMVVLVVADLPTVAAEDMLQE